MRQGQTAEGDEPPRHLPHGCVRQEGQLGEVQLLQTAEDGHVAGHDGGQTVAAAQGEDSEGGEGGQVGDPSVLQAIGAAEEKGCEGCEGREAVQGGVADGVAVLGREGAEGGAVAGDEVEGEGSQAVAGGDVQRLQRGGEGRHAEGGEVLVPHLTAAHAEVAQLAAVQEHIQQRTALHVHTALLSGADAQREDSGSGERLRGIGAPPPLRCSGELLGDLQLQATQQPPTREVVRQQVGGKPTTLKCSAAETRQARKGGQSEAERERLGRGGRGGVQWGGPIGQRLEGHRHPAPAHTTAAHNSARSVPAQPPLPSHLRRPLR